MSLLSKQMLGYVGNSSLIRKMFEAGIEMKAQYGADAVFDFSLGNPDLPPPSAVADSLQELSKKVSEPFSVGYMPTAGYLSTRKKLAEHISKEQGVEISSEDVLLTCGAAGGINVVLRTIIEPLDEVICIAPYFVEYGFYVENHGGVLRSVPSMPITFALDVQSIENAITDKTCAIILNSPNNPTGQVYTKDDLVHLFSVLEKYNKMREKPIVVISDEPYRFLAYGDIKIPSMLAFYDYTVVVSSFSKSLSLAGERIGYIAINPLLVKKQEFMAGLILANRILGFVNAPALAQQILEYAIDAQVDVSIYAKRRNAMADVLDATGYSYSMPHGAFYFFPKAPNGDDITFCQILAEEKILAVPGTGFAYPGYFRLAFCVDENVIVRSEKGFRRAMEKINK